MLTTRSMQYSVYHQCSFYLIVYVFLSWFSCFWVIETMTNQKKMEKNEKVTSINMRLCSAIIMKYEYGEAFEMV